MPSDLKFSIFTQRLGGAKKPWISPPIRFFFVSHLLSPPSASLPRQGPCLKPQRLLIFTCHVSPLYLFLCCVNVDIRTFSSKC
ncbi:hypothetical protein RIF29_39220 [Crotalaria pallida]|uniref:Uncharacterized protein n=1 Tax=Crotalaria pallida TaxID=3830 RepID=A0AAN9E0Q2_CROPI